MNEEKRQRKRSTLFSLMFIIAVVVIATSILFTALLVHYRTEDIISQADLKLLMAAELSREILGPDYHDRIVDERSISKEQFNQIVARNDDLCRRLKLQYLWSILLVDKRLVFTSATHSNLTDPHSPCASFFEKHRDPEAFASALTPEGKTSFSSFHNEWGQGRQVLIPGKDARGRTYIFGASIQLTQLDAMVRWTILTSLGIGMAVIVTAFLFAMALAHSFTTPIERLTKAAERMATGHLDVPLVPAGTRELNSLAISLDHMRQELQQHLEALRKSEELLKKAQEIAHIGSWELNLSTNLLIWSDEVFRIFGLQPQEINATYESFLSSIHPDDRTIVDKAYRDSLLEGRDSYQIEHRVIRTNTGEVRVVQEKCEHIRDISGKIIRSLGMVQDITAEKRDQEALNKSHQTFLTVLDGIDATIYVADMETYEILFMNKCMIHAFGADLTGRICHEVFRRESSPCGHCTNDQLLDADGSPTSVCVWEMKNPITGKWYINHDRAIPWIDGRMVRLQIATDITKRKRTEEELMSNRLQLSNALEMAHLGHWEYDVANDLFTFNDHFYKIFRTSVEQVGGYTMHSAEYAHRFVHPDDMFMVGEETRKAVETMDPHFNRQIEHRILYEDGEAGYINVRFFIIKDSHGRTVKTYGVNQDITERKLAEQALRESESKYRLLADNVNDVIFALDMNLNYTYVSPSVKNLRGYEPEELLKQPSAETLTPSSLELATRTISEVMELENTDHRDISISRTLQMEMKRKDGTTVWTEVKISFIRDENQRPVGILGLTRDITERKNAEEALKKSERNLADIVEFLPDATFVIDLEGKVVAWNRAIEEMTGILKEEMLGQGDHAYAIPFYGERRRQLLDLIDMSDKELDSKYISVHRKGNTLYAEAFTPALYGGKGAYVWATGALLFDDSGNRVGAIESIRDITEQKKAEVEKRGLEERLNRAEKMEALGTLAGGVAHDLNNVLGIVVGYSEMILDGVDKSSPIRHGLENIMSGGLKAAAIVDDLLTLARRGVPGRSILNLNKIIADNQKSPEFANLSFHHPSVKIKTDLEADLLNIAGSSIHLGKSIYNLVSNASEAMANGGTVAIKTTNQYIDKPIQGYDQIREGDYVVLSVSDTGEGISAHDLKRIFEPFYTKKIMGRSGTGLGLAVVWGTVKDHQGYINVVSEEGKGSAFTLYFPVTREEITADSVAVGISEYMGNGESILVVDDVKEQRDLATSILKALNYSVSSVSSGEEAVAYMKEHKVDLIVLDMIMDPGMDGLDTYRSILEIHPQQKAIIASGFSETHRVNAAQSLGAGAYVRKPFIKEKMGVAVRKELDRT